MRYFFFFALVAATCACSRHQEPAEVDSRPAPAAAPAPTITDNRKVLAVFGDSLAAGYGLSAGQSFPDYLQKKLDAEGLQWHVVNLGISGDTTEEGVARID